MCAFARGKSSECKQKTIKRKLNLGLCQNKVCYKKSKEQIEGCCSGVDALNAIEFHEIAFSCSLKLNTKEVMRHKENSNFHCVLVCLSVLISVKWLDMKHQSIKPAFSFLKTNCSELWTLDSVFKKQHNFFN